MVQKALGIAMCSELRRNIDDGRTVGVVVAHGQHGEVLYVGREVLGVVGATEL